MFLNEFSQKQYLKYVNYIHVNPTFVHLPK